MGFYDKLSPFYHLIYPDWEQSIGRQARNLDAVIRESWGDQVHEVLDAACGVGTQAIGLAQLGYQVTACDISPAAIERAKAEATKRGLNIAFSVANMSELASHYDRTFDLIIASPTGSGNRRIDATCSCRSGSSTGRYTTSACILWKTKAILRPQCRSCARNTMRCQPTA